MFMFRRRRATNLTKKLLRKRRATLNGLSSADRGPPQHGPLRDTKESDVQELLKKLQENQLEMLLTALDSCGREFGHCVLVPREYSHEPHLLCCQYWRWPEVKKASELRRFPQCGAAVDSVYACCNPYHWSRVLNQPETPPPPYSRTNEDRIRPEDRAPSELPLLTRNSFESLTTSGDSHSNRQEWCKLAYWELRERVGPLFPVEPCHVNIFGNVLYGENGFSLAALGPQNTKQTEASRKTLVKIGLGVTLSRDPDGSVWLYNRSEQPVFVHSWDGCEEEPTRVPADYCVCVHAPGSHQTLGLMQGPAGDPNSIRISFVKGWGSRYLCREITSCPCWLEVLLAPCR